MDFTITYGTLLHQLHWVINVTYLVNSVFIASIGLTFLSGLIYIYKKYMKEEYTETKKLLEEIKQLRK